MSLKTFNTGHLIWFVNLFCALYGAEKQKLYFTLTFPKSEIQMFSNFS
jgi:hypothetical protein